MTKVLRIAAKREGYRRCGVGHSEAATDHPIEHFTDKQIDILKADSMLIVQEVDEGAAAETNAVATEIDGLLKSAETDQKAAAKARGDAEADRAEAAKERTTAEKAAKEAKADREEAAKELDAAKKTREAAAAASAAEKPAGDGDKPKGGKKAV